VAGVKQVVLRGGSTTVADIPAPSPAPGRVLVANAASVISSGTERATVASGGGSLPMRAIRNPDLVVKTLQHLREHGVRETVEAVRGAVGDDMALGYSTAGVVLDTGGIGDFRVGDRVACAGAGSANHAEIVSVPGNLVAHVPDGVELRDAAFTTLGSIALQGVRRTEPTLGERVVVVGLGLLGLITVQLLRAAGCPVLGIEPQAVRRELALELGAERAVAPEDAAQAVKEWAGEGGADAVVVTASSASDAIVNQAVELVRRKGRVVPVGDVGLGLERPALYQREADILISTSYGPGRYDRSYEEGGVDYPPAYVRWTENRNMQEFLRLLGSGQVRVGPLVDMELPVEQADEAYAAINADDPPLAAVLTYDAERSGSRRQAPEVVRAAPGRKLPRRPGSSGTPVQVALIGAGDFVRGTHLPNLKALPGAEVHTVVARGGTRAGDLARAAGGAQTATDWSVPLSDPQVDLVLIGTRHDSHAEIAAAALRAGKAVFVEKPLGLSREEIDEVWAAAAENDRLAIGFNRPFAPLARQLGAAVEAAGGPIHLVYRVNAPLPADHWLNDAREGGGRILGEACHMFDFANWLCGTPLRVHAAALPSREGVLTVESASVTIEHEGGSVATVHYSGVGGPDMPKERIEVLRGGRSWVLDDFRSLTSYDGDSGPAGAGGSGADSGGGGPVDKGHRALLAGVIEAVRGGGPFEPGIGAAYAAQSVAIGALEAIATGAAVNVVQRGTLVPAAEVHTSA
jgi:predicted dehydrogenase/threonine dehydrogenase-like Zn-dependent dehydrogenase